MLEKFEIKLNELKKKINKKALGVGIFMVFGALIIFGLEMANNFKRQKNDVQDSYNKAMYQIVDYVKNVETELAKLQISNTQKLTTTTLADIWRQSNLAKENLDSLPVDQNAMANASKYFSQVSDYSYSLMKQVVAGEKITDKQNEDIKSIYENCVKLSSILSTIYENLNTGRIQWDELKKSGNKDLPNVDVSDAIAGIEKIGENFQQYEGLIYDGAFSDHLLTVNPKSLSDKEITEDEAKIYLTKVFGEGKVESIIPKGETKGRIDLYNFDVKLKESSFIRNVNVTKKEGKMYLMIGDREVSQNNITIDIAKKLGLDFLKKLGIDNVKDTYFLTVENMAIINYAAVQDNVLLYPDLVKVKIALDNGEICSVESQGYTFNHTKRKNLVPKISMEKAKKVLNKNVKIISEGMAIIPTDSNSEVLTYEFKGKIDEKEYLIYINAETGEEEKILLILDTPGGILTM